LGRIDTDTMGGVELTVPTQAAVMILMCSSIPQDTITTGVGERSVPGFTCKNDI
jgi:hypothetical protein